nr:MAG TPA: DNA-binding protein [Caudoviricetes sp.]
MREMDLGVHIFGAKIRVNCFSSLSKISHSF